MVENAEIGNTTTSKVSLKAEWQEGKEEDFKELHEAKAKKKTRQHVFQAEPDSSDDEERIAERNRYMEESKIKSSDEEEDDTEPDDTGPKLLWACQYGKPEVVRKLLQDDPSLIEYSDADGYTALHRACYTNNDALVLDLLMKGGDVTKLTEDGWTPLHSACRWNSFKCVEVLLGWGSNPNYFTKGGQSPLHLASFHGSAEESIQLLLMEPSIITDSKNAQGDTPLDVAKRKTKSHEKIFTVFQSSAVYLLKDK